MNACKNPALLLVALVACAFASCNRSGIAVEKTGTNARVNAKTTKNTETPETSDDGRITTTLSKGNNIWKPAGGAFAGLTIDIPSDELATKSLKIYAKILGTAPDLSLLVTGDAPLTSSITVSLPETVAAQVAGLGVAAMQMLFTPTDAGGNTLSAARSLAPDKFSKLDGKIVVSLSAWGIVRPSASAVDTTPPVAPIVTSLAAITNNTQPTWTWTSGGGGNGTYRVKLDNATLTSGATELKTATYSPASALSDGAHTLYVQESDDAGNWSDSGSFSVTVSTTAPGAPTVTGTTPTSSATPTWSWTSSSGNGTFRYKLDDATLSSGATITTATSYTPGSALTEAVHTLYVQEQDTAGNWSASGSFAITVATTAIVANSSITGTSPVVADGTTTSTVTITLKNVNNVAVVGIVPTFSATNTGTTNAYGTCSATSSSGVSTCTLRSTKAEAKTLSIATPVSKADGTVVFQNGPAAVAVFTTQPADANTTVALATQPVVTLRDVNGNTVTTGVDATATVTMSLQTGTGTLGGTVSMAAVAGVADFTGKGLNFSVAGAKTLRATKASTLGSGGTGSLTVDSSSITITDAVPVLTSQANFVFPSTYLNQGSTATADFDNTARNPADDTGMTYACAYDVVVDGAVAAGGACTALAGAATFNTATGAFSWTPNASAFGPYEIKVTGTNSSGSDGKIFVIDVRPAYVTTNLVGNWDAQFANLISSYATANATWKDLTSNAYDGTSNSTSHATWVGSGTSSAPFALSLDGAGYVDFGTNVMSGKTKLMFSAWVNSGSAASTDKVIFGNSSDAAGNGFTVRQSTTASKLDFLIGSTACTSTNTFVSNTWYFIGGIYDGATAKLYVNGGQECSVAVSSGFTTPASGFFLGATDGNSKNWTGKIADLKIYATSNGSAPGTVDDIITNFDKTLIRYQLPYTWIGGGGNNNWSNTANWQGGAVPGAGNTAIFSSACSSTCNVTIDANVNVAGLFAASSYTGTVTQSSTYTMTIGSRGWVISAGTFTGGTGAVTLNGAFAMYGGTYSPGNQTITDYANWTYAAGTFNPGSSTVVFYVSGTSLTVSGSLTFNNLTLSCYLAGTITIASGTQLTATGTTSFTTYYSLTVNTGTIEAQGNISAATGGWVLGNAPLLINGTANQTYSGSGGGYFALPITINKTGGTLTLSGSIAACSWTYTAGTVDPGTSTVTFATHYSYTGANTISGTQTFYNLSFNAVAIDITLASGTTLTATGSTTFFSNGSFEKINGGAIIAKGNINTSSNGFYGTTTFTVNGTGNQTWTGGGFIGLATTIDKPSGTLTLASTITVASNWTYVAGTLDAGTSTLAFSVHYYYSGAITVSGSMALNNLSFSSSQIGITLASGTTLTATGTTTFWSYGNPAAETINGGTIYMRGNISMASNGFSGTTNLVIDGAANQTWTGGGYSYIPTTINKSGGTLTLAGNISQGANLTYIAGTMDPGTSTMTFSCSWATINISGSMTFNNLTFADYGTCTNEIASGTTLTATGTTTLSAYYPLVLNTGTIEAKGNIVSSNANGVSGTATLLINGTAVQSLTGGTISMPTNVNKSGGQLNLATNFTTYGNFTITAGTVNLQGKTLTVGSSKDLTIGASGVLTVNGGSYSPTSGVHFSNSGTIN